MDMNVSAIDTAFLQALTHASSPPAIVRPFLDPFEDANQWWREFDRTQNELEAKTRQWIEQGQEGLEKLAAIVREYGELDVRHRETLKIAAETIEARALQQTNELRKPIKQFRRLAKRMADILPQYGDVTTKALSRLEASWKEEIDARLEAALFFRALRAEYDPAARNGQTFSDHTSLESYLTRAMAS